LGRSYTGTSDWLIVIAKVDSVDPLQPIKALS